MADTNQTPVAAQKSHVVEAARAVTRPTVTIIFAAVLAQVVVEGIEVPDWFIYGLAMPCILWWFGERTVTHLREKKE